MNLKKNQLKIVLLLMISLCSAATLEAQIWKKLKDKVSKKVENKIDKSADKILDKTPSTDKKSTTKSVYNFDGSATIEITTETRDKAILEVLFSKDDEEIICMLMDNGESGQIYNVLSSKQTIAFMNVAGMKIKQVSPPDQFSQFDNSDRVPSEEDLKKTGNVRKILGYTCHEYSYSNDGGKISAWITQEDFPIKSRYAPMLGMTKKSSIKGFVLELNSTSANGEKANIRVVKIDKNKKVTINSSEYKSMF